MPFKSYKQQAYLFAKKPKIAKKWAKKYGTKKKPKGKSQALRKKFDER